MDWVASRFVRWSRLKHLKQPDVPSVLGTIDKQRASVDQIKTPIFGEFLDEGAYNLAYEDICS